MPISLGEKLRKALLEAKPFSGICYRNVSLQYANRRDIISAQGSINAGGRFNFKGAFDVLYLSGDLHTCLEETTKSLQRPGFEVAMLLPCVVIGVKVNLQRILDLTDATTRRKLGITPNSLIATDWEECQNVARQEAFTQQLGRLARDAGFEGLLVPSAVSRGKNLDVFPDRLLPGSSLRLINRRQLPRPKR